MEQLALRNPRVVEIRGLSRQRKDRAAAGRYVVEGSKLVAEAIDAGVSVVGVFVDEDAYETARVAACVTQASAAGIATYELEAGGLERVTSTKSSQGIVAVVEGRVGQIADLPAGADFVLAGVDINDPGNAGTLLRTAVAAGADAAVTMGESVDFTNPKTIRASAGAFFKVPVITDTDVAGSLAVLRSAGLTLVGAAGEADATCDEFDFTQPVAIVLGSEAHGLSPEARALLDAEVRIDMPGPVESLNVAMAGAILSYEVARQRRSLP